MVLVKGNGSLERVETRETVECGKMFEITKSKYLKQLNMKIEEQALSRTTT